MKRSWIGAGILLFLLIASAALSWAMGAIHEGVAENLDRAASEGDWAAASQAEAGWQKWHHFRSCFADQTPVEAIDAQFARLEKTEDPEEFAALASETAQMVKAMGDSHDLNLWSFF